MIRRGPAPRLALALLVAAAAACGPAPLAECDAYLATIEKLASCPAVPADARGSLATSALQIRQAVSRIQDADDGGKAVALEIAKMRSTCRVGTERLREELGLRYPTCQ